MTDATALAARRYNELHPGYHLVAAIDAAIPFAWLTLDVIAQERKPLPLVEEFVLRLCAAGVDTITDVAAVLGMKDDVIRDSVAYHLSAETLDYRPDPRPEHRGSRIISLSTTGTRTVNDLEVITPRRVELPHAFNRLLWAPSAHLHHDLITRDNATARGMLLLPSTRTHEVTTQEVSARALNRTFEELRRARGTVSGESRRRAGAGTVEVLSVEEVIRQRRRYLPAVLLVYSATGSDDIRLTLVVDDLPSREHDDLLAKLGGAYKLGITVAPPKGEPDLPQHLRDQRAPYDTVRALQRRIDAALPELPNLDAAAEGDRVTAREELDALTVRCVPVFEHPELLANAIEHTRRRFLLVTSTLHSAVVTDNLITQLKAMLRRTSVSVHIAYGPANQDSSAVKRLRRLADRHDNLTLTRLDEPYPHCLIFDDTWINSSFEWLSYRGGSSPIYRREEGTLIREIDFVDGRHAQYVGLIESARRDTSG
ncbi:hypothetical protein SAMN05444920_12633 [Nonomuraea solani]|uniref:Uncharacterized protein n=1 Tax=Nonomuraea solani TaxID=1144553 RepID=A0A1H6EZS7_9ACTN|nr:hypothetical protein [Nonomuraea solani]SEH02375.1 hypothetical protein SAMN05444920_12633 [Nonomuraea solani]